MSELEQLADRLFDRTQYGYAIALASALCVTPAVIRRWHCDGAVPKKHAEAVRQYLHNRDKEALTPTGSGNTLIPRAAAQE